MAYLSPQYHGLVYGAPVEASVHVMEGEGWGPKIESVNRTTVKIFGTEKMTWQGECFLMTGVLGFALVSLLAVSSLPSVTANLTWKEFAFIQSGLGWLAMILLCGHDMFYGWKYMDGPSCGIPSSFQVRPVWFTLISRAPTRLGSHWSRSNEAWLSSVSFIVLLCQLSYAIMNQLGHPKTQLKGPIIGALMLMP